MVTGRKRRIGSWSWSPCLFQILTRFALSGIANCSIVARFRGDNYANVTNYDIVKLSMP